MNGATIRFGTSGWQYRHWRVLYYPEALTAEEWLSFYAAEFGLVEVSESYYELPGPAAIAGWCRLTDASFRFSVVCPRSITRDKKLKNCARALTEFLVRLDRFGERLGPVLFRLPERWHCNLRRLSAFLGELPRDREFAFEFRDPSWHNHEVEALLSERGMAACISDGDLAASPLGTTAGFVYVRLAGPAGGKTGSYPAPTLRGWAGRALGWQREGRSVYLFFGNDERAYAVKNARIISGFVQGRRLVANQR